MENEESHGRFGLDSSSGCDVFTLYRTFAFNYRRLRHGEKNTEGRIQ